MFHSVKEPACHLSIRPISHPPTPGHDWHFLFITRPNPNKRDVTPTRAATGKRGKKSYVRKMNDGKARGGEGGKDLLRRRKPVGWVGLRGGIGIIGHLVHIGKSALLAGPLPISLPSVGISRKSGEDWEDWDFDEAHTQNPCLRLVIGSPAKWPEMEGRGGRGE